MAADALRKLHSSLDLLDPEIAEDLYAQSLITRRDKEKIDSERMSSKKASTILTVLARRNPKKALQGLIKALEKNKEENEELLKKISEVYPDYKFTLGQETDSPEKEIISEVCSSSVRHVVDNGASAKLGSLTVIQELNDDYIGICERISVSPDVISQLADSLKGGGFITQDTRQAVKSTPSLNPYDRATKMMEPAIYSLGEQNTDRTDRFIKILQKFGLWHSQELSADAGTDAAIPVQSNSLLRAGLGTSGAKPPGLPEHRIIPITRTSKLNVKESGDQYQMNCSPHGYCIIINNVYFKDMPSREGSNRDASALQQLFGNYLDFNTQRFNNLESKDILAVLREVQEQDHSKLDCLVVTILSHGVNGQIYGSDGVTLSVNEITAHFLGTRCPSLAEKPKIFILQACRGGQFDHGVVVEGTDSAAVPGVINEDEILGQDETDGGGYIRALPDEADFILAYATTPGYVSWRNSDFGTWFIKAFTDTMYEKARTDHLMDILTEVNRKVAEEYESRGKKKQMPAPVTMLRYKLFLSPNLAK